jgi:hypothetical protein
MCRHRLIMVDFPLGRYILVIIILPPVVHILTLILFGIGVQVHQEFIAHLETGGG